MTPRKVRRYWVASAAATVLALAGMALGVEVAMWYFLGVNTPLIFLALNSAAHLDAKEEVQA